MQEKVKPFVKWAGGKGSLIPQISEFYPCDLANGTIERYVEPFVGGGSILIDILQKYNIKEAYAFDINRDLINTYQVIKDKVEELIVKLKEIEAEYLQLEQEERKRYFYNKREEYNSQTTDEKESVKKASEFIYLNRTCFNGLYRVNKEGKFNVPIGNYKNPMICNENNLRALSNLIQNVQFQCADYKESAKYMTENTFVYFDPPYRPLNQTSAFTSYTKEGFDDEDQKELALYYRALSGKGIKLMLSNSNPKNTREEDTFFDCIYQGFHINEIYARRMISANLEGRKDLSEIVITNYDQYISNDRR